jgi:hypothetical protein
MQQHRPPPNSTSDPPPPSQTFDFLNLAGPSLILLAAAAALRDEAASRRAVARRSRALLDARRRAAEGLLGRLLPAWAAAELEARPPAAWAARATDRFEDCVLVQCDLVRERGWVKLVGGVLLVYHQKTIHICGAVRPGEREEDGGRVMRPSERPRRSW